MTNLADTKMATKKYFYLFGYNKTKNSIPATGTGREEIAQKVHFGIGHFSQKKLKLKIFRHQHKKIEKNFFSQNKCIKMANKEKASKRLVSMTFLFIRDK